jgi:flavodoxin
LQKVNSSSLIVGKIIMKTLVVYYSRTGKTRFVAERVASELKADIEEVVDLKNRSGRFGFLKA